MGSGGDLLVVNTAQVVTLAGGPRAGSAMAAVAALEEGAVAIREGTIVEVGSAEEVASVHDDLPRLDAGGGCVVPGFVDAHTHPVFAGDRSHELAWKLQGLSYREVAERGGGIGATVEATRDAPREELAAGLGERLDTMLLQGTTTVEAKSGYGLTLEDERKLLTVLGDVDAQHPVDLAVTLLAAHDVPPERAGNRGAYVEEVVAWTPELAPLASFVDVFTEEGWFTVEESRRILEAGRDAGLGVKVHADELARSGGSQLAAEVGATSADHLLQVTGGDVDALAAAGVVAVLCPATALSLNVTFAPARMMLERGATVALGTDFNPNTWCPSMPLAMALACHGMRMTPSEALTAATVNAAASCGRQDEVGSLEEGKRGDLVVLDAPTLTHLAYRLGENIVRHVVKDGAVVVEEGARKCTHIG